MPAIQAVTTLFAGPVFTALAEEAVRGYIDWAELTKRLLPAGLSAADNWEPLSRGARPLAVGAFAFVPARDSKRIRYHQLIASRPKELA